MKLLAVTQHAERELRPRRMQIYPPAPRQNIPMCGSTAFPTQSDSPVAVNTQKPSTLNKTLGRECRNGSTPGRRSAARAQSRPRSAGTILQPGAPATTPRGTGNAHLPGRRGRRQSLLPPGCCAGSPCSSLPAVPAPIPRVSSTLWCA